MDLEFDVSYLSNDCPKFAKVLTDNTDLCIICQMDETKEGKKWERFQLSCGHIMHTHCFQKWCATKMKINCPYCGDIKDIPANYYCIHCEKFGHSMYDEMECPKLRQLNASKKM